MEAHPTGAAFPSPIAAPQPPPSTTTPPPPIAAPQEPAGDGDAPRFNPATSEKETMEAHPTGAAIPSPIAAPQPPPSTTTPPPPIAAPQEPAAAAVAVAVTTVCSPHLARFAFLVVAALMSASWFVEPFAAAAADLRVPWPAVVATLVCFAASFCASVLLFDSFFMLQRPPPGAAAVMAPQWKGVRAVAAVFAAVVVGVAACLVAACGSAYGYAGTH